VSHHQTAEDLANDTITLAWRGRETYDPTRPFWPWLAKIAVRQLATAGRSGRLAHPVRWDERQEEEKAMAGIAGPPLDDLIRHENGTRVREAILALPPKHREVVLLNYFDGLQVGEISDTLGVPEGTLYRWLSEARNLLEAALADLNPAWR
jgi:RNA polymerase sigma-70 factor (ECF subfamily)